jgi:CDP-diacylglycerol--serine O-phosphatidyltransferase
LGFLIPSSETKLQHALLQTGAKTRYALTMSETEKRRPNAIYLLPNLVTTGAMFAGFYAIVASINQRFELAALAVFFAALLDGMDGRLARATNTQSEFGVQYDSLSDLVSFGLAPALIVYNWSLVHLKQLSPFMGKLGWLAAFTYAVCAALRLARFNTQVGSVDKRFFVGLASPAAAAALMTYLWVVESYGLNGFEVRSYTPVVAILIGLLMVSRFRYFSFKAWPKRVPFYWLLLAVMLMVSIALEPPATLTAVAWLYAASGPVYWLWTRKARPAVS